MPATATDITYPLPAIHLRSGTVARLADIPVATLRIWERRYQVVAAPKSPGGQRLYTPHDVDRLRLLRRLTLKGHAIGTIAMLPLPRLQLLSDGTASKALQIKPTTNKASAGPRLIAVGVGLQDRLAAAGWQVAEEFADLPTAQAALEAVRSGAALQAEGGRSLVVIQLPTLQPAGAAQVERLIAAIPGAAAIVCYAFGAEAVVEGLRQSGVQVIREPAAKSELARVITQASSDLSLPNLFTDAASTVPPRRFSDADLRRLGEMQTGVACECPRHVAGLVLMLSSFERYSAECQSSTPADAVLHRDLNLLAGSARALLEQAMDRVIAADQLALTTPARSALSTGAETPSA